MKFPERKGGSKINSKEESHNFLPTQKGTESQRPKATDAVGLKPSYLKCESTSFGLPVRSSESGEEQTLGKGPQNSLGKRKFIKNSKRNLFVLFDERQGQNPEMNRTLGEETEQKR